MSILNKSFITDLIVLPNLTNYDELQFFMHDDIKVQSMFPLGKLLVNTCENSGSDTFHAILFKYENKYVFLDIMEGTCDRCFGNYTTNAIHIMLTRAVSQVYITTNQEEVLTYVLKKLSVDDSDSIWAFPIWKSAYLENPDNYIVYNVNTCI